MTTCRLIAIILLAAATMGRAQEAAQPSVKVSPTPELPSPAASSPPPVELIPSPASSAASAPASAPISPPAVAAPAQTALPEPQVSASPVLPELSALDQAFNQTTLGKEADERFTKIEIRKLQNEVARNPQVIAAKAAADHAPTDLEKRQLLREYYNLNYGLMSRRASTPALKAAIDQSKSAHIALLAQPRVRPENGKASTSPGPTPVKKKPHPHKHF